ncbi:hypothetical protein [Clostridium sp. YIM B02500]|uniref:hypothetical protein n=1 Tax=Clostridium sp. YIM B02500 TaxID=2910681 RepID=UPI001EEEF97F|nr:hypothetical protein [Clostridium sp. YIM B02500]
MSDCVQVTLIICGTMILCSLITLLTFRHGTRTPNTESGEKIKNIKPPRDNQYFGYCKSPTYPRPLRPGCGIGHNPSPAGEKPGFPGRKSTDTLEFSQEDE